MTDKELVVMFKQASEYAENAYYEVFNYQPDTSNPATQQLLNMLIHAWLSGYNYLRLDQVLEDNLFKIFGYNNWI